MKKKLIIFGSIFVFLLLIMLPSISAVQSNTNTETPKEVSHVFEKSDIPNYIWFAIYLLILSIVNRLNREPL